MAARCHRRPWRRVDRSRRASSINRGLVIVALQVVITVIAASFYNIFAELFGGLEIVVREEGEASR